MSLSGLENLDVWRKARNFAVKVYREILPSLPQEEKWGLNQQIRRAAQSVPANIAEGYGRYYYQENIRSCYIERGSLDETISHLSLAHELEYIPDILFKGLVKQCDDLPRLINGYIAYLKRTKQGEDDPGADMVVRESKSIYDTESIGYPSSESTGSATDE